MPTTEEVLTGHDLSDRTVLVTGATAGIGQETARALAGAGARVVLAGRGAERLARADDTIRAGLPGARLDTVELDLADLASVRAGAVHVLEMVDRLDVLVNNAGVMFAPLQRTADGFELQLGTNHLGHFLFTRLLEPLLTADPGRGARVVTVSSDGHRIADIDLDDPNWEQREYDKFAAYGAAKTANILFTVELDRRLRGRGVRAYAVHPGTVATNLARHMDRDDFATMNRMAAQGADTDEPASAGASSRASAAGSEVGRGAPEPPRLQVADVAHGAATSVWAATASELDDRGGRYLADCAVSDRARGYALDPERAARLWRLSERLTGLPSTS